MIKTKLFLQVVIGENSVVNKNRIGFNCGKTLSFMSKHDCSNNLILFTISIRLSSY